MLTTAYYFLQVTICSAMLLGYYWLVLRNKRFHQYNRFYLLGVGLLSWLVPLIKIQLAKPEEQAPTQLVHFANIVASSNTEIEQIVVQEGFVVNWNLVVMCIYATVCGIFLSMIAVGLYRVFKLLKTYSCKSLGDVYLIMTSNVKGTPFSFFQYIFWNDAIDANTATGQQMMQHELTHVREKHSIDKLFMQLVMVFGWFNPFFWLLKRELHLVHEFIADNKAIKDGDASSLAAMLLTAAYPNQQYLLGNPFFFSPIKRRILMLTKTNNPRMSYARRVVVLPLLAVTVMLFAFRKQDAVKTEVPLEKVYTVVIDAGHGGKDFGASAADGTKEKDLALLLLKAVKAANTNDKIKLVFTREEDVYQTPIEKAKFVNDQKADLFVSLHINWATKEEEKISGIELVVPKSDGKRSNVEESKALATSLQSRLIASFNSTGIHTKSKGVWILGATTCPAVLLECGYLSNAKDLALLKDNNQRSKMAELLLQGIGDYLKKIETANLPTKQDWDKAAAKARTFGNTSNPKIDTFNIDGKNLVVSYHGQKVFSIKYDGNANKGFTLVLSKKQYSITLKDVESNLDKLESALLKGNATPESVEEAKALYVACLMKKEEWELTNLQDTRAIINKTKAKNFGTINLPELLTKVFAANDLLPSSIAMDDLVLLDLIKRRNDLISKDKSSNAKAIQFLNSKIDHKIKNLQNGKPALTKLAAAKSNEPALVTIHSPLSNSYIKQKFGPINYGKITGNSDGIVICSKTDNKVKSVTEGKVTFVGLVSDVQVVIIRSEDNFFAYSNLNDVAVQKGQTVSIGSVIGIADSNGTENEISLLVSNRNGKFIDPETTLATR